MHNIEKNKLRLFSTGVALNYSYRNISFLPYSKKAAITKLRGHRGRRPGKSLFVNQGRGRQQPYSATLNSSRFFQKNPLIVTSSRYFHLSRLFITFLKSGAGLIFTLRNLQLRPLSYFFYNYRGLLPKHPDYYTTKQLLFLKVGSRLVNVRDIFSEHILFAVAFGSYATLRFFDRWSGFLTLSLPSGMSRLFFFLSRADYWLLSANKLLGINSKYLKRTISRLKAGTSRLAGCRPKVRGVAKNPVDHPHGGRTKAIRFQRTPWGKPAKLK